MTQEEKQLLLIDLCARFPYGVKVVDLDGQEFTVKGIDGELPLVNEYNRFGNTYHTVGFGWKPYLRPMSSMTEEELHEYNMHLFGITTGVDAMNFMIWIYQHHLDILHFIEKGLALEAPEDMYKMI